MTTQELAQRYLNTLPVAFQQFQGIEDTLRQYLGRTEVLLATLATPVVPYTPNVQQFASIPLGTLVAHFRHRNAHTPLQTGLARLVPVRNHYLHRGYLFLRALPHDAVTLQEAVRTLDTALAEAATCLHLLGVELADLDTRFRVGTRGMTHAAWPCGLMAMQASMEKEPDHA